jgi:DNA ligase 1
MSLKPVFDALEKIAVSSTRTVKKKRISAALDIPYFKEVVRAAYDSRKVYKINKFPAQKSKLLQKKDTAKIFEVLNKYAVQKGVSNQDVNYLHSLCADDFTCEVVSRIVNKDLRCGVNIKTWKEYFPDLLDHSPMLCQYAVRFLHRYGTYSEDLKTFVTKVCGGWENVIGSIKANGVRVWIDTMPETPTYTSRSGKPYENFRILNKDSITLAKEVQKRLMLEDPPIIDGEVTFLGEDFQDQMKQVRRIKDMDPSKFRLVVFDSPSIGYMEQAERSELLSEIILDLRAKGQLSKTTFTEEVMFENYEDFDTYFLDVVKHRKLEGLVLKKADAPYELKRSPYWCKVKDFFSADVKVIDMEEGTGKYEGMMGALWVDFNGVKVRVGSGFSDTQRVEFWKDMPEVVEIEYKTITKDGSLQHPSFHKEREDLIGTI